MEKWFNIVKTWRTICFYSFYYFILFVIFTHFSIAKIKFSRPISLLIQKIILSYFNKYYIFFVQPNKDYCSKLFLICMQIKKIFTTNSLEWTEIILQKIIFFPPLIFPFPSVKLLLKFPRRTFYHIWKRETNVMKSNFLKTSFLK